MPGGLARCRAGPSVLRGEIRAGTPMGEFTFWIEISTRREVAPPAQWVKATSCCHTEEGQSQDRPLPTPLGCPTGLPGPPASPGPVSPPRLLLSPVRSGTPCSGA